MHKAFNKNWHPQRAIPSDLGFLWPQNFRGGVEKSDSMFTNMKGLRTALVHVEHLLHATRVSAVKETHQARGPIKFYVTDRKSMSKNGCVLHWKDYKYQREGGEGAERSGRREQSCGLKAKQDIPSNSL